jgi:hypothetical protein
MSYPSITDYKNAVKYLESRTENLQTLKPIKNNNGELIFSSGRFAAVFKLQDTNSNKKYALKCFLRDNIERKERYEAIYLFLKNAHSKYFCEYEYLDSEFAITPSGSSKEELYPVVKMEWVEGETLGIFLKNKCNALDSQALNTLYNNWIELSKKLYNLNMSHGDLKHDNMIISSNLEITLIDYDGMFVPSLAGRKAIEEGSPNYQHPKRHEQTFNEKLDYFSMTIIALSIKALSLNQNLFNKFNNDDNIIFSANDFNNLFNSDIYKELYKLNNKTIKKLLDDLFILLYKNIYHLPYFLQTITSLIKPKNLLKSLDEQNAQLFIFNIDNKGHFNKGSGKFHERIQNIINTIFMKLNQIDGNNIANINIMFIEYNWLEIIDSNQQNYFFLISEYLDFFKNSYKTYNFKDSVKYIEHILNKKYKLNKKATIINIFANKIENVNLIFSLKDIANIYNIYVSDRNYVEINKYPNSDYNLIDFNYLLYHTSSILENIIQEYLHHNFQIPLMKDSRGLLIDSSDVETEKFLEAILLTKNSSL